VSGEGFKASVDSLQKSSKKNPSSLLFEIKQAFCEKKL
jgi:hypothetical protein